MDSTAGANPDNWGSSLVSVQPGTGKILAMAQNTVFLPQRGKFDTQLNFNVDSKDVNGNDLNGAGGFQPGSTMKPFTFAEWLQRGQDHDGDGGRLEAGVPAGIPLAVFLRESARRLQHETRRAGLEAADDLQNATDGYYRKMPVNYGLYNSINTATFASAAQLDFCGIQNMVDAVGIHSGLDGTPVNMHQLGNLLGATGVAPLHMANAFATFAADGRYCEPFAVLRVADVAGQPLPGQAPSCRDAVDKDVARGVNAALQDVLKGGIGHLHQPQGPKPGPRRGQDRNEQQQRRHVGPRLHHRAGHSVLLRRRAGGSAAARQEPDHQRKVLQPHRRVHDRRTPWAKSMFKVASLYPAAAFPKPPAAMVRKPPTAPRPPATKPARPPGSPASRVGLPRRPRAAERC